MISLEPISLFPESSLISPIVPSSASTDTPKGCATLITSFVILMLSSNDSLEASIITEVNPQRIALCTCSIVAPWSKWIHIGTWDLFALSLHISMKLSPWNSNSFGWIAKITGACFSSQHSTTAFKICPVPILKAGTAKLCSLATDKSSFMFINISISPFMSSNF